MIESVRMAKIPGKLVVDVFPDCMLRLAFIANIGPRHN